MGGQQSVSCGQDHKKQAGKYLHEKRDEYNNKKIVATEPETSNNPNILDKCSLKNEPCQFKKRISENEKVTNGRTRSSKMPDAARCQDVDMSASNEIERAVPIGSLQRNKSLEENKNNAGEACLDKPAQCTKSCYVKAQKLPTIPLTLSDESYLDELSQRFANNKININSDCKSNFDLSKINVTLKKTSKTERRVTAFSMGPEQCLSKPLPQNTAYFDVKPTSESSTITKVKNITITCSVAKTTTSLSLQKVCDIDTSSPATTFGQHKDLQSKIPLSEHDTLVSGDVVSRTKVSFLTSSAKTSFTSVTKTNIVNVVTTQPTVTTSLPSSKEMLHNNRNTALVTSDTVKHVLSPVLEISDDKIPKCERFVDGDSKVTGYATSNAAQSRKRCEMSKEENTSFNVASNARMDSLHESPVMDEPIMNIPDEKTTKYLLQLNTADEYFFNDNDKFVCWILGRFLANEEIAARMIEKYRIYYATSDIKEDFDHPQSLMSYFLTMAFNNLPPVVVTFLLSEEHRTYKGLQLPKQLKSGSSLGKLIKDKSVYSEIIAVFEKAKEEIFQKLTEATMDKQKENNTVPKRKPKASFVRLTESDESMYKHFSFAKRWSLLERESEQNKKSATESYIMCGKLSRIEQTGVHSLQAVGFCNHLEALKSFKESEKGKSVPRNFLLSAPRQCKALQEVEGDVHFELYEILGQTKKPPDDCYTNLAEILRKKPYGCSTRDLVSWPWNADCEQLVKKVQCCLRVNTTVKYINKPTTCHQDFTRRTKGKRGRKSKKKSFKYSSCGMGHSDNVNEICNYPGCQVFREDFSKDNVAVVCRSVVVYPLLENSNQYMMFLSSDGIGNSESTKRKVLEVSKSALHCDCSLNEAISDTVTTSSLSITLQSGDRHHHDDLFTDILLPVYVKDDTPGIIISDVMVLLSMLWQYVRDVHLHDFCNVDMGDAKEVIAAHIRSTQSLCEAIFSFLVFSEICGPAELHLSGAYYLTTAHVHYETARDFAIEAGVFPVFAEFVSKKVFKLPCSLQIVKRSSIYSVALSFLDIGISNDDLAGGDWVREFDIEPVAVNMLESAFSKDYFQNVDDDIAYDAILHPEKRKFKNSGNLVVSPIANQNIPPAPIQTEFAFTSKSMSSTIPNNSADKSENIAEEIFDAYTKLCLDDELSQRSIRTDVSETADNTTWDVMHDVFADLHTTNPLQQKNDNVDQNFGSRKDDVNSEVPVESEGTDTRDQGKSKTASDTVEIQFQAEATNNGNSANCTVVFETVAVKKETGEKKARATIKVTPNHSANLTSNDAVKAEIKIKKSNKEYLSSAKRQQRQAKKLREKWEKKHTVDDDASVKTKH